MIVIVAENHHQFRSYCKARGLHSKSKSIRYASRVEGLQGLMDAEFILTGTYWLRKDWKEMDRFIYGRCVGANCTQKVDQY